MVKKILPLCMLILLDAIFLGIGMSFGENLHIVIIDCALALFLVVILLLFKLFFEAIILRGAGYVSKSGITMYAIARTLISSLKPAVIIMMIGNIIQLLLGYENDIFQICVLTASQVAFFSTSIIKLSKYKNMAINVTWVIYNIIFIIIEVISIVRILTNVGG